MGRTTKAARIEQANEARALAFFEEVLAELPDPRRGQGLRYPLRLVIVTSLMATVCGCDDAEAMEAWGRANEDWLSGFLPTPHGTPTQDVFLAVFAAIEPSALHAVLRAWAALLAVRFTQQGKHIAVDGKTSRRTFDRAKGKTAIHTVSAFLTEAGIVLGEVETAAKSNEITAIPELLNLLDISGATITIDAMGCQTKIAKTIVEGGGDYLLAVKDNQPALRTALEETFAEVADDRQRTVDETPRPTVDVFEEVDKGHGRVETRRISVCRDLDWVLTADQWHSLDFLVLVERERTVLSTGRTSTERAFYIGSDSQADAEQVARHVRRHWSIENELHWVLDMAFREDDARHRARNTASNMTTIRHFALNIIKSSPNRKLGVANTRRRAGWDRSYLLELLNGARP